MNINILRCGLLLVALPHLVVGHDLILQPALQGGILTTKVTVNHPGDYSYVEPDRITGIQILPPKGEPVVLFPGLSMHHGKSLDLKPELKCEAAGIWILSGGYDNGLWVELPGERHVNASLRDFPDAKASGHYRKLGKTLLQVGGAATGFDKVVGMRVELVPLLNPYAMKPGEKLPVRLLFQGKPVSDAGLEISDGVTAMKEDLIPRYQTDAQGVAHVPISKTGWQHIIVDYTVPDSGNAMAAKEVVSSSLLFELAP